MILLLTLKQIFPSKISKSLVPLFRHTLKFLEQVEYSVNEVSTSPIVQYIAFFLAYFDIF